MNETNRFILLRILLRQGPLSRGALSTRSGLSKMTVTDLMREYISNKVVRESGSEPSLGGRRASLLEVAPDALPALAVSVGRDNLIVGIVGLTGKILWQESVPMASLQSCDALLKALYYLTEQAMHSVYSSSIWGIGVSSMGPLDFENGTILNPCNFQAHNIPVVQALTKRYQLPVYLENDMCVSALAELYYGGGRDLQNFLYVGVTAGIGGGIVVDGRLFGGTQGLAGSIGHMIVEPDGLLCGCGQRGCLEMYASTRAILAWAKKKGLEDTFTWNDLLEHATKGNGICVVALGRMARYLHGALTGAIALLDPQCIFLGGDLQGAEHVVDKLNYALQERLYAKNSRTNIPVRPSEFPGNAALIGAAALVMENNLIRRTERRLR